MTHCNQCMLDQCYFKSVSVVTVHESEFSNLTRLWIQTVDPDCCPVWLFQTGWRSLGESFRWFTRTKKNIVHGWWHRCGRLFLASLSLTFPPPGPPSLFPSPPSPRLGGTISMTPDPGPPAYNLSHRHRCRRHTWRRAVTGEQRVKQGTRSPWVCSYRGGAGVPANSVALCTVR